MFTAITRFGRELGSGGLKISVPEMLDAFKAVSAIGVEDRGALRNALACTLCKRTRDSAFFNALFDARFPGKDVAGGALVLGHSEDGGGPGVLDELMTADLIAGGQAAKLSALSIFALTGEGMDLLLELFEGGAEWASSAGQVDERLLTAGLLDSIGWEPSEREIREVLDSLRGRFSPQALAGLEERTLARLRRAAEEVGKFALSRRPVSIDKALLPPSERELAGLTRWEMDALKNTVRKLAEKLRQRALKKKKTFSRGRLDMKKVMRDSSATDGIPWRLTFRKKVPSKPELVVLCDLSDSVRNVSALMLQFMHALHGLMNSLRSFVFVNDVGETTGFFTSRPIEDAVSLVLSGRAASLAGNSNYGNVLRSFAEGFGAALGRRTTLLIIGDGRTNYLDPGIGGLLKIRRRTGRIIWLTPEREKYWASGDSAMPLYRRYCDKVSVVGTVSDLKAFAENLVL